jgi:predicted HTH domain antitoxin
VELPAEAAQVDGRAPDAIAADLRLLWVLDRVRTGRISIGKAAELASMNRWDFMRVMGEHEIPVINYPPEDLARELGDLKSR